MGVLYKCFTFGNVILYKANYMVYEFTIAASFSDFRFALDKGVDKITEICGGCIEYAGPEHYTHEPLDGRKCDIWSL